MIYEEQQTQMMFVEWLEFSGIKYYNHSPNEGKRTAQEGNKNKRMGTQRGFPDLEIPMPRGNKHGFYIEFKSAKGRLTPEQRRWLMYLNSNGYEAVVARSFDEARKRLCEYLNGGRL